jgi:hypothetical protein
MAVALHQPQERLYELSGFNSKLWWHSKAPNGRLLSFFQGIEASTRCANGAPATVVGGWGQEPPRGSNGAPILNIQELDYAWALLQSCKILVAHCSQGARIRRLAAVAPK